MKYFLPLLTLFTTISPSYSVPATNGHRIIHEKRDVLPHGWTRRDLSDKSSLASFRFALKQRNLQNLEVYLMDIADPDSPNYGRTWTHGKVVDTFAPDTETIETVKEWLMDNGHAEKNLELSKDKAWLEVKMSVQDAELLLDTNYDIFEHADSGTSRMACDSYSLPPHVGKHIELILPGTTLLKKRSISPLEGHLHPNIIPGSDSVTVDIFSPDSLETCDQVMTLSCLRALYNYYYTFTEDRPNMLGVPEYTPQALLYNDLDVFFKNFSPSLVGARPNLISIDGGTLQTVNQSFEFNGESALDLQYTMSLVAPTTVQLYQVGDLIQGGSDNNLLDSFDKSYCTFEGGDVPNFDGIYPDPAPGGFNGSEDCGTVAPAYVISVSYGEPEVLLPRSYIQRQCNEFGKLGLTGHTILYASGDAGVGSALGCLDEMTDQFSPNGTKFAPNAPTTCPFVTAVGATLLPSGSSVYDPESAAFFGGGGFSNVFPRPAYQDNAVTHYLKYSTPEDTKGHFNASGRGYPDISANGFHYTIAVNGMFHPASGTSASTPVVASLITAINDARMNRGKGPVGFINPTLYSRKFTDAFNDITNGSNPNCTTGGFVAAKGWDPVTGVGTPNFPRMLELWLELP